MRTMGETRLWYSFFLPLAGIITYSRWRYKWILSFSFVLSLVFICINLFKPEIHNKTLMPALQSPWFAPHVIVYMFAYAMLGAAAVMAVYLLWIKKKATEEREMELCDNLVNVGLSFMTLGMLFELCGLKRPGALLELGSEGNLGGSHVDRLSLLYPLPDEQAAKSTCGTCRAPHLFCIAANVLVWH